MKTLCWLVLLMGLCLCQVSATESTLRLNTGDAVSAAYYFDQHRGSDEGKGICFCSAALAFVGMTVGAGGQRR